MPGIYNMKHHQLLNDVEMCEYLERLNFILWYGTADPEEIESVSDNYSNKYYALVEKYKECIERIGRIKTLAISLGLGVSFVTMGTILRKVLEDNEQCIQ